MGREGARYPEVASCDGVTRYHISCSTGLGWSTHDGDDAMVTYSWCRELRAVMEGSIQLVQLPIPT